MRSRTTLVATGLLLLGTAGCGSDPRLPTGPLSTTASTELESHFQSEFASEPWFEAVTDYEVQGRTGSVFVMGGRASVAPEVCRALLPWVRSDERSLSTALVRNSAGQVVRTC